jgi:hypothetical protein
MSQMYQFPHYGTQRSGTMRYERGGHAWGGFTGWGQNDDTASTAPATITALEEKYTAYFDAAPETDRGNLATITAHVYADMIGPRMLSEQDLNDYTWWMAEVVYGLYMRFADAEWTSDDDAFVWAYSYTQEAKKYAVAAAVAVAAGMGPNAMMLENKGADLLATAEKIKGGSWGPPVIGPDRPYVPLPPLSPEEARKQQMPGAPSTTVAVAPVVAIGGVLVGGFFLGKLFKWW